MQEQCINSDDDAANIVYEAFARSRDFNGISLVMLAAKLGCGINGAQEKVERLLGQGKISLCFESHSVNPHIKRLNDLPIDTQIFKLRREEPEGICVYPSHAFAAKRITGEFDDRPYTKRLALAEPQLTPAFFELPVLERYFRDPRYMCRFGDSAGYISIGDKEYLANETRERDKISIRSFGIGYDSGKRRVVVVFLCYLSPLSSAHQHYWKTHEVSGPCTMNSDYELATIWGRWSEHYSAYAALIQEQLEINELCKLIGKPPLFRETFEEHKRPINFSSMLRPTQAYFDDFVHLLDKMISDNIDLQFFRGDISLEERIPRGDGSVEARKLGSLTLLERWLQREYRDRDGKDVSKEAVAPFKEVRNARQPVAHTIVKDEFNPTLPAKQDELVARLKKGLTILRWILSSHPSAHTYRAPEWLDGDKIVFY